MSTQIAYFNRFSLELPEECVDECSRPGQPADESVAYWRTKVSLTMSTDDIRAELKSHGAWDEEELKDNIENEKRLIWIAACNIREEMKLP